MNRALGKDRGCGDGAVSGRVLTLFCSLNIALAVFIPVVWTWSEFFEPNEDDSSLPTLKVRKLLCRDRTQPVRQSDGVTLCLIQARLLL